MDIIFSCDVKFCIPLVSTINSIITNTSSENKLRFNIVCDDTNKMMSELQLLKKEHKSDNFDFRGKLELNLVISRMFGLRRFREALEGLKSFGKIHEKIRHN